MCCCWASFFLASPLLANQVKGTLRQNGAKDATINISVGKPAPMAYIVLMQLPRGVDIVSAQPAPGKGSGGNVKWLFSNVRPGNQSISMKFSKPVSPGQLRGEIRFRQGKSNAMITTPIR